MSILMMLAAIAACAGETPAAPRSEMQPSAGVSRQPNYSFSISTGDRTVRVRFTKVRSDEKESVSSFMQRMFASADAAGADRLVLDLRAIKGGDSFMLVPLVKGVLARERFARPGGIVLIVGPDSFSPEQNAASVLQRYANPIFAEQPIT